MLTEIILSGFGGQGILFAGKDLAYSGMSAGKEISWLPSYGPEMRGGTANCSVCISDEPIGSPLVAHPDILIVMNTPSFDRFESTVKSGGVLFADSGMTDRVTDRSDIEFCAVPAAEIAEKNGLGGMGNIVLLGRMFAKCGERLKGITVDTLKNSFKEIIPPKKSELIDKNIKALMLGYNLN
jgi:2-oxoglutarate ferredoxin oxidoreductase subunit gamma